MAFSAGQKLLASQLNTLEARVLAEETGVAQTDRQATGFGTTTSTSFTATLGAGGTGASKAFVAPVNGKVVIHNAVYMFNSGANSTLCTIRVRTGAVIGSGTDVLAASNDDNAVINNVANGHVYSRPYMLTGLTPGASYNVQQLFRVGAGTGTYNRHAIVVETAA